MEDQIKHYENKLAYEWDSADLYERLENDEKIVVIDTRKEWAYDREHIPVAINLPHRQMDPETTRGFNKNFIYVCYCDGIGCNGSTRGSLKMAKLGFDVRELIGGIDWWKRDGYSTEGTNATVGREVQCAC